MSEKSLGTTRDTNVIARRESITGNENTFSEFNKVWVSGIIEEKFVYSHELLWEKYYKTRVIVKRQSGTEDYVPIVVSDMLMPDILDRLMQGKYVEVAGQFRSYNKLGEDGRWYLELFLFATAINVYENEEELENVEDANLIYLEGNICKPPVYRETPFGRQITDLTIAVGRTCKKKSDYIPCVSWGRIAQYASRLEVGNRIKLFGRVQSRQYFKRFSPDSEEGENRTAYEISIMRMVKVEEQGVDY